MTEYVIREAGPHHWLVFADRKCIAVCTNENAAEIVMNEHNERGRQSHADVAAGERPVRPGGVQSSYMPPSAPSAACAIGLATKD